MYPKPLFTVQQKKCGKTHHFFGLFGTKRMVCLATCQKKGREVKGNKLPEKGVGKMQWLVCHNLEQTAAFA
jgi:hypothetical protein